MEFRNTIGKIALKLTDWYTRPKSIGLQVLKYTWGPLAFWYGGFGLIFSITKDVTFLEGVEISNQAAPLPIAVLFTVGGLIGLALIVRENFQKTSQILLIEGRGLRDDSGDSLRAKVSGSRAGVIIDVLFDVRQARDGKITDPELIVDKAKALRDQIMLNLKQRTNDKYEIIYGGLTSVPTTFLTGMLLDDESAVTVFDWDRELEDWREISKIEPDDGIRFLNLEEPSSMKKEEDVVLKIPYSYDINDDDIKTSLNHSIYSLDVSEKSSDKHWSFEKQKALSLQFFETVKMLNGLGAKRIHLIFAAPNSLVFQFGRAYDIRNLPEVIVYQYERGQETKYPWGINMPSNEKSATISYNLK